MIYGYCRATTSKQLESGFLEEQEDIITERYFSCEIIKESSLDISEKPEFEKILGRLKEGDTLVVTTLDRISKTFTEAQNIINDLRKRGVYLHVLNIGSFDDSVLGGVLYNVFNAVTEFDKAILVERIQTGKNRAKKVEGFKEGRPKKYTDQEIEYALNLLESYSYKKVESMTGISKSTLIRARKDHRK